jgi:two-component system, response regulator
MKENIVLLVEDSESDVFITKRALDMLVFPYKLVIAENGVEALNFLFGSKNDNERPLPDFVLLDIKLPMVDGLQVLQKIRSDERTRNLPVYIVTSSSEESDITTAKQFGANSYSIKPTHARDYYDLIHTLVGHFVKEFVAT